VVGDIEDILSRETNRYVLLEFNGRFIPVPWQRFDWNLQTEDQVLAADPDELDEAPGFTSLNQISGAWDNDIDVYWREH
jgi:hypothetical protein